MFPERMPNSADTLLLISSLGISIKSRSLTRWLTDEDTLIEVKSYLLCHLLISSTLKVSLISYSAPERYSDQKKNFSVGGTYDYGTSKRVRRCWDNRRIMDWGHPAPFYSPFPPFSARLTNRPRANMLRAVWRVVTGHYKSPVWSLRSLPACSDRSDRSDQDGRYGKHPPRFFSFIRLESITAPSKIALRIEYCMDKL